MNWFEKSVGAGKLLELYVERSVSVHQGARFRVTMLHLQNCSYFVVFQISVPCQGQHALKAAYDPTLGSVSIRSESGALRGVCNWSVNANAF